MMKTKIGFFLALVIMISGSMSFGQGEVAGCKTICNMTAKCSENSKRIKNSHRIKLVSRTDKKSEDPIDFWEMINWDKTNIRFEREDGSTYTILLPFPYWGMMPTGCKPQHNDSSGFAYIDIDLLLGQHPDIFTIKWNHQGLTMSINSYTNNYGDTSNLINPTKATQQLSGEFHVKITFLNAYGIDGNEVTFDINADYNGKAKVTNKGYFNWNVRGKNIQKTVVNVIEE